MRHARISLPRTRSAQRGRRVRAPLALLLQTGVLGAICVVGRSADAQISSSSVPLPNVLLLLDTSGSFEYMIDGSNPEDPVNNPVGGPYAQCESAWNAAQAAVPNRWGIAVQALTGTVLNAGGAPHYSCVTMDRADGIIPPAGVTTPGTGIPAAHNGFDIQYGLRATPTGGAVSYFYPYDSGYYLNFHRPVSQTAAGRCVYSPAALPGASAGGGVGLTASSVGGASPMFTNPTVGANGATVPADCLGEPACQSTDFPADAIGTYLYDGYAGGVAPLTLLTPNYGFSTNSTACTFNQATDGIIAQSSTLVRFGLMTFDNDPSAAVGVKSGPPATMNAGMVGSPESPFLGQWSYFNGWTLGDGSCVGATSLGSYTSANSVCAIWYSPHSSTGLVSISRAMRRLGWSRLTWATADGNSASPGEVIAPTVGSTRSEEDFFRHIQQTVATDPKAGGRKRPSRAQRQARHSARHRE